MKDNLKRLDLTLNSRTKLNNKTFKGNHCAVLPNKAACLLHCSYTTNAPFIHSVAILKQETLSVHTQLEGVGGFKAFQFRWFVLRTLGTCCYVEVLIYIPSGHMRMVLLSFCIHSTQQR